MELMLSKLCPNLFAFLSHIYNCILVNFRIQDSRTLTRLSCPANVLPLTDPILRMSQREEETIASYSPAPFYLFPDRPTLKVLLNA